MAGGGSSSSATRSPRRHRRRRGPASATGGPRALAGGGGQDGRLEVHEVFGLTLSADLVVLSACQTALGSGALADVPAGDDWVGLSRAFLSAGAAQVVATLWPVEDRATADLMTH